MKALKILLIITTLFILINNSNAQMDNFTTPPYVVSTSTQTAIALPGPGGPYSVANGAYDGNGMLMFYVQDYGIYDANGNFIDYLPVYAYDNYEIEIINMLGQQVMQLMPSTRIEEGVYRSTFDISKLQNGIYSYRIKSVSTNYSGIISKD